MKGRGLGNIFARIFRSSIPYLKSIGRYAKNQLLEATGNVVNDMKSGMNVREAFKKNVKTTKNKILNDIRSKMSGRGSKRKRKNTVTKSSKKQKLDQSKSSKKKSKNKKKNNKKRKNRLKKNYNSNCPF